MARFDHVGDEFRLARNLRKRLFGILIEDIPVGDLPPVMTQEWQLVNITPVAETIALSIILPRTANTVEVRFSAEGLHRLKVGLLAAGLDARFFAWPPPNDPGRPPYRGLLPFEAEDAGIFFGRDAPIATALDQLRQLREAPGPRLMVVLGASGAGKSSFLRAGLLPRLSRDQNFLTLPVLRPARAALSGDAGLIRSLEAGLQRHRFSYARAQVRAAVENGAEAVQGLLAKLVDQLGASLFSDGTQPKPPTIVLPIDQAEELFSEEGHEEADQLLRCVHDLLISDAPPLVAVITIRSDSYEKLQIARSLDGIHQNTISLPPLPRGEYHAIIKGPLDLLRDTPRNLVMDPALTEALLADIESGGARDALPLLAFTLERLYVEYGGRGRLTLADYEELGRIKGSIQLAVERALVKADENPKIPRDRDQRLHLLRRGLIPWLAGIDPETEGPRRNIAPQSEIPAEALPLIQCLVEQRLLSTDRDTERNEITIEPAHEALLRQWGLLSGWLEEDLGALTTLEGIRRASRDWAANNSDPDWLSHTGRRLVDAEKVAARDDFARFLKTDARDYLQQCHEREKARLNPTAGLSPEVIAKAEKLTAEEERVRKAAEAKRRAEEEEERLRKHQRAEEEAKAKAQWLKTGEATGYKIAKGLAAIGALSVAGLVLTALLRSTDTLFEVKPRFGILIPNWIFFLWPFAASAIVAAIVAYKGRRARRNPTRTGERP